MSFTGLAAQVAGILAEHGFPRAESDDQHWFWITPERIHVPKKNRVQLTEDQHGLHLYRAAWDGDRFVGHAHTSLLPDISAHGIAELIQLGLRHLNHFDVSTGKTDPAT